MTSKSDREAINDFLATRPDGAQLNEIAGAIGKSTGVTSTTLSTLQKDEVGWVTNPERGIWRITKKGLEHAGISTVKESPPPIPIPEPGSIMTPGAEVEPPPEMHVPGAYEKFMQIGRSLGIKEDFLKVACDHIFIGNVYDLNYVWDTLNGLYLRPDVTRRWFNIWSRVINQPIPAELISQVMPSVTGIAKEAEAKAPPKLFDIIGDEIIANPEGEFTFSQARQVLMTKAIQNAAASGGGERLSELLTALKPYLEDQRTSRVEEIKEQGEASILATLVKSLIEQKGSGQQPLTLNDVLSIVDKVDEARRTTAAAMSSTRQPGALDELERLANVFNTLKGIFVSRESSSQLMVPVKGSDGEIGAIPLDTLFKIRDHERQERQEEEEFHSKQDTAKSVRKLIDGVTQAAASMGKR